MFVLQTDLNRLKSLRVEVNRKQTYVVDVKTIAGENPTTEFRQLIEDAETRLARLQDELHILTATVTKAIDETFATQSVLKQVMKLRELESETFDVIARRLQHSSRWVHELHKRGLELMTDTTSPPRRGRDRH